MILQLKIKALQSLLETQEPEEANKPITKAPRSSSSSNKFTIQKLKKPRQLNSATRSAHKHIKTKLANYYFRAELLSFHLF